MTVGINHVRVWQVDPSLPKMHAIDARLGQLRREIQCVAISEDDGLAYCGTRTGEVLAIKIDRDPLQSLNVSGAACRLGGVEDQPMRHAPRTTRRSPSPAPFFPHEPRATHDQTRDSQLLT